MGILALDEHDRVIEWQEKPKQPKSDLASMGVYVFSKKALRRWLTEDRVDFGRERHPGHARRRAPASSATASTATGRTSARSSRSGRPTWPSSTTTRSSTCTTRTGSSTPGPRSARRPRSGPTAQVHRSLISHGCVIDGHRRQLGPVARRPGRRRRGRARLDRHVRLGHPLGRRRRPRDPRQGGRRRPGRDRRRGPVRRPAEQAGAGPPEHRDHRRRQAGGHPARRAHRAQRQGSPRTSERPTSPGGSCAAAGRSRGPDRARAARRPPPVDGRRPRRASTRRRGRRGNRRRDAPPELGAISARLPGPCHPPIPARPRRAPGRCRGLVRRAGPDARPSEPTATGSPAGISSSTGAAASICA